MTKNVDDIRMQGLKRVVNDAEHRKEFIAGNLQEYTTQGLCSYRHLGWIHC